ncbi:MAG: hypothetical protein GEU94_08930 [Micromonosporaceae bacterium]|nr:hypothetical protein [Micromonosporaceae bacterium]
MPASGVVRRLALCLFLASVALGLAAMHTLGHPVSHDGEGRPAASAESMTGPAGHDRMTAAGGHVRVAGQAVVSIAPALPASLISDARGTHDGFNPAVVCLAVLVGVFAVAALILFAARRRPAAYPMRSGMAVLARPRGPPPRCARRLAQLSVLRI